MNVSSARLRRWIRCSIVAYRKRAGLEFHRSAAQPGWRPGPRVVGALKRDVPDLGLQRRFRRGVTVAGRRATVLAPAENS